MIRKSNRSRLNWLYVFLAAVFISCENMGNNPLVVGHRGAMGHETENTVASVRKALELGVDMIEIDVFKIESGEIVVFHDENVERLSNGGGNIESYNIVDLNQLILEGNHKIPQLQDVMKEINHRVRLNIELKGANTADRVNFIVNSYIANQGWSLEDFLISSFRWEELEAMRNLNPDIAIGVLTEGDPLEAVSMAQKLRAEAVIPHYLTLTASNVSEIQEAGFKVYTWTVDEEEDIEQMKSFNVDAIITNYPERVQ